MSEMISQAGKQPNQGVTPDFLKQPRTATAEETAELEALYDGTALADSDLDSDELDLDPESIDALHEDHVDTINANKEKRKEDNEKAIEAMTPDEKKAHYRKELRRKQEQAVKEADWAQDLYVLTDSDKVIRVGETEAMSMKAFNALHGIHMNDLGIKQTAVNYVAAINGFKKAAALAYGAGLPSVFKLNGKTFINTYKPDSAPVAASEYTFDGLAAVETVRAHLRMLFADENTARMIETWIALNVRAPGKLIRCAPLIKGAEGDGKTIIFSKLMRAIMGTSNVSQVALNELGKDFNAWAGGAAIRVFEEIKASGQNRYSVLDSLKAAITNDTVTVVRKRMDGVEIPNTTNYVGLTNHADALPISDGDRRWWILFTPYQNKDDIQKAVGDIDRYFERLANSIRDHAATLRKYFLECELHKDVHYDMRAPETKDRELMMKSDSKRLGSDFLDSYIAEKEVGITEQVIVAGMLTEALIRDMGRDNAPQSRQLSILLKSRGYIACEKVFKWDNGNGAPKTYRVYVKDEKLAAMDPDSRTKIRDILAKTVSF